jgi:hypothetical protein
VCVLIAVLVAGLGGCVTSDRQDAPEIQGQLVQGEKGLEGIRVSRAVRPGERAGCDGAATVTTDAQGRFHFPRVSHRERSIPFGDPLDEWRLCFELTPGGRAWWGRSKIAAPPRAVVSCTPAPGAHETYAEGRGEGVACHVRDERKHEASAPAGKRER